MYNKTKPMMEHINKFDEHKKLYELKSWFNYKYEELSKDIKNMYDRISDDIEKSPIQFKFNIYPPNGMYIKGPFGMTLSFYGKKGDTPYVWLSDGTNVGKYDKYEDMDEFVSSDEYKYFIKGKSLDDFRNKKARDIVKAGKTANIGERDALFVEYLKYAEPTKVSNKQDASGPWSTSGTSITTYKYDIEKIVKAWPETDYAKSDNKAVQEIYDKLLSQDTYVTDLGSLDADVRTELEENPYVDVWIRDGKLKITMYSLNDLWSDRLLDLQDTVAKALGHDRTYGGGLGRDRVLEYKLGYNNKGIVNELTIKVETRIYHN